MRTKIAAVALVVLMGIAACCRWPNKEPVYKGRGIREFIHLIGRSDDLPAPWADEGLKFFGTNMVPYMRAALRTRDSWYRGALARVAYEVPSLKIPIYDAGFEHYAALVAYDRILTLDCWGAARGACAHELEGLTNDAEPVVKMEATELLLKIEQRERRMP